MQVRGHVFHRLTRAVDGITRERRCSGNDTGPCPEDQSNSLPVKEGKVGRNGVGVGIDALVRAEVMR